MNEEIMKQVFPKAVAAVKEGICPFCHQKVDTNSFRDDLSRKEFGISGLCQKCQDDTFGAPEKKSDNPEDHNYRTEGECDGCGKKTEITMLHAKGATGRICPVMAMCDNCK